MFYVGTAAPRLSASDAPQGFDFVVSEIWFRQTAI
jgi:hypothetical protein